MGLARSISERGSPGRAQPEKAASLPPREGGFIGAAGPGVNRSLALADRAVEARPPRLHDAGDGAGATRARTGLALAVVDEEGVLEIAWRALGIAEIAQGRAARRDGLGQHV